jgi:hypothetical protein
MSDANKTIPLDLAALERASHPKRKRSPLWDEYYLAKRHEDAAWDTWKSAHSSSQAAFDALVEAGEARYG